jgi:hypothetical protein
MIYTRKTLMKYAKSGELKGGRLIVGMDGELIDECVAMCMNSNE